MGAIETNSKPSFEQMFANSFLQYLHSSDLSFISSADSFLCSSAQLGSWNHAVFSRGIFKGNPGENQLLADEEYGVVQDVSGGGVSADEPHLKG